MKDSFICLLDQYDFFDAVEIYLTAGVPSELESLEQWKELSGALKLQVEELYTYSNYDLQDSIFRVYMNSVFPDKERENQYKQIDLD